jgi:adenylylsulfate kinase-like enzyme
MQMGITLWFTGSPCSGKTPIATRLKEILSLQGIIQEFTGMTAPYKDPLHPDFVIDTEHYSVNDCVVA